MTTSRVASARLHGRAPAIGDASHYALEIETGAGTPFNDPWPRHVLRL
jgi:hypothetical protein